MALWMATGVRAAGREWLINRSYHKLETMLHEDARLLDAQLLRRPS